MRRSSPGRPEHHERAAEGGSARREQVLQLLAEGTVESCEQIPWGSNSTFWIVLRLGGLEKLTVYKPRRGERPLWDFPSGTLYRREYGAFVASRALGWPFVPGTVIREGPYGIGSVQLWVDAQPLPSIRDLQALEDLDLARIAAFDFVTNNADRKAGHVLRELDGKLWSIDHGLCFNVVPKVRTVLLHYCGRPVPGEILAELAAFREDPARRDALVQELTEVIADEEIAAFWSRVDGMLEQRTYPWLDPYRSVPWPPF